MKKDIHKQTEVNSIKISRDHLADEVSADLFASQSFRQLLESFLQFQGKLFITLFTNRLHVKLHKLVLESELCVAGGAGETTDTPGFVQSRHHITFDHSVAVIAHITKQLVIMSLTVGQPLPLIMAMSQEWLLTFSTHKMLNMPLLAHSVNNTPLYGSPTGTTDRDPHLIMAWQTVKFPL